MWPTTLPLRQVTTSKVVTDYALLKIVFVENVKVWFFLLLDTGDPNQHMAVAGEFGRHRLYKMLGYFSLVGLLRLHSLLGDYHQALRVIDNMNVNRKVTCASLILVHREY